MWRFDEHVVETPCPSLKAPSGTPPGSMRSPRQRDTTPAAEVLRSPRIPNPPLRSSAHAMHRHQRDLLLVRKTRSGDRPSFDQLFDLGYRLLTAFAAAQTGDPRDVGEIVGESLRRAVPMLGTYAGERSLGDWLLSLAAEVIAERHGAAAAVRTG